jgi:hypothetical protein
MLPWIGVLNSLAEARRPLPEKIHKFVEGDCVKVPDYFFEALIQDAKSRR